MATKSKKQVVDDVASEQSSEEEVKPTTRGKAPKLSAKKSTTKGSKKTSKKTDADKAEAKLKKDILTAQWETNLTAMIATIEEDDGQTMYDGNTNCMCGLSSKEEFGKLSQIVSNMIVARALALRDIVGADEIYDPCHSSYYKTSNSTAPKKKAATSSKTSGAVFAKTRAAKQQLAADKLKNVEDVKNAPVSTKKAEAVVDPTDKEAKAPALKNICPVTNSGKFAVAYLVNRALTEVSFIDESVLLDAGKKSTDYLTIEEAILSHVRPYNSEFDCSVIRLIIAIVRSGMESGTISARSTGGELFNFVKALISSSENENIVNSGMKKIQSFLSSVITDFFTLIADSHSTATYFSHISLSLESIYANVSNMLRDLDCAETAVMPKDYEAFKELSMIKHFNEEFFRNLEPPEEKKKKAKASGEADENEAEEAEEPEEAEDAEDAEDETEEKVKPVKKSKVVIEEPEEDEEDEAEAEEADEPVEPVPRGNGKRK